MADELDTLAPAEALRRLREVQAFLTDELEPHEREDDRTLYPLIASIVGGDDPTAAMSRGHQEIRRLIRRFVGMVDDLPGSGPDGEDIRTLRGLLYGLHAVLRLHFAQEEDSYLSLGALELPVAAAAEARTEAGAR